MRTIKKTHPQWSNTACIKTIIFSILFCGTAVAGNYYSDDYSSAQAIAARAEVRQRDYDAFMQRAAIDRAASSARFDAWQAQRAADAQLEAIKAQTAAIKALAK